MRTKNLLTAIVLPSLFAACTADELVKIDNGAAEDLSKRPIVEGVTINLGGAETKAVVPEGGNFNTIQYETEDKLGALLVDRLTGTSTNDPISNYTLETTKFNTNYQFSNVGGTSFASEAYMVEGNYVFYFPYNEKRTRDEIRTALPATQKLAQDANGNWSTLPDVLAKSEAAGAPIALGYDFISSTDASKTANVAMKQIYAMPEITLVNDYTENELVGGVVTAVAKPIRIQEITLSYGANEDFILGAPLKFSANGPDAWGEAANAAGNKSIIKALFNEAIPNNKKATHSVGVWTESKPLDTKVRATSDMIDGRVATASKKKEIVLTLDEAVEVPANGTFTFYAVIPAENYTTNKLKVMVTNEAGLSTNKLTMGAATLYPGRRYPIEEYTEGNVNDDLKGTALTASVSSFNTLNGVRVSTVDELINAVKTYTRPSGAGPYTLQLRVAGTAVINKRVADFLKATTTLATNIEFVNAVNIEGTGVTLDPAITVEFKEGANVVAGANVTVDDATKVVVPGAPNIMSINVASGATLTLKAGNIASVNNAGTLNIVASTGAAINNSGTVNVTASATLSSALTNGNTTTKNVAAVLNVAKGKTLTLSAASTNAVAATINNEGTIAAAGKLTNNGTINNGSEDNYAATATLKDNVSIASCDDATINNYAVLTVQNDAVVEMKSVNANATVTGTGTVNNDVLAIVTNTGSTNKVKYTMTGNQTTIPNYLVANSINTLVLKNVALTLSAAGLETAAGNLDIVVEGTTTIAGTTGAGSKQMIVMSDGRNLKVEDDATLTIMATAGIKGEISGGQKKYTITNDGTIVNNGSVENVKATGTSIGTVEGNTITLAD